MTRNKKLIAAAAIGLLVATWAIVLVIGLFFEPSLALWLGIVTAAALATEAALWVGAAFAGIALFAKVRARLRLRGGPAARSG